VRQGADRHTHAALAMHDVPEMLDRLIAEGDRLAAM
jgi:hypothetical protein